MALFDTLKEAFRQNPPELDQPHFYKASSESKYRLDFLREFWWTVSDEDRPQLERDIINLLEIIEGDRLIEKELMASELPIVVLHDVNLAAGDESTRIDYLVITAKFILIIECKDLFGQIEVMADGRFYRTCQYEDQVVREEIASPLSRIARNLDVIRKLRAESHRGDLWKAVFERNFDQNYLGVAIAANPSASLDLRAADLAVKSQIIRSSQLADHIANLLETLKREPMPEKYMYELAYFFMSQHRPGSVAR